MKIAYILPALINQGPIIVVKSLSDYLVCHGCEVDIYYFDDLLGMQFKCMTHHISMDEPIDFDRYDIIHSHCLRSDRYIVKWKKSIHRSKIISTLHQDTYRSFRYQYNSLLSNLFTWYWCRLQSQFDAVISISNQLKNIYDAKIKTNITTIYNGCPINYEKTFDDTLINKLQNIRGRYKLLGTYAFVTRRKGLGQVLEVLSYLTEYALAIIGEGPDIKRLKRISVDLEVADRVFFFPYQKSPRNYLPYFDIYVMPSYSEGFGLSMVEAALAKRPIVCSNLPSFHEIFANDEVSYFELNNVKSLKDAIVKAYDDKDVLGRKAYERSCSFFTLEKMAENHLAFYQRMLAGLNISENSY